MGKSNKGSNFEREICKQLSLWWSDDKDEDIFWRTAGSGARATTRAKKGKKTYGNDGDIQAVNPIGEPLMKVCNIELKRGYSKHTITDLIDKPKKAKKQMYEKFIEQTIEENTNSGAKYWMLITKRDRREALVLIPHWFYKKLKSICVTLNLQSFVKISMNYSIYVLRLYDFLMAVTPKNIKKIYRKL